MSLALLFFLSSYDLTRSLRNSSDPLLSFLVYDFLYLHSLDDTMFLSIFWIFQ